MTGKDLLKLNTSLTMMLMKCSFTLMFGLIDNTISLENNKNNLTETISILEDICDILNDKESNDFLLFISKDN